MQFTNFPISETLDTWFLCSSTVCHCLLSAEHLVPQDKHSMVILHGMLHMVLCTNVSQDVSRDIWLDGGWWVLLAVHMVP